MDCARRSSLTAGLLAAAVLAQRVAADEGMWPLNRFSTAPVQQKYGFTATPAWLDQARLASVRFADGCSGSFVSATGLVMTNYHCVVECVEALSSGERR